MSEPSGGEARAQPERLWLFIVGGVLALVLLAVAYVQWRQFKLLDTASSYQNDALGWSFSQLETEQLRLRNEIQLSVDDPGSSRLGAIQLRYDIFVSRVGLVDHARAARIMAGEAAYPPAMAQVRAFIARADRYLGEGPVQPLDAAAVTSLLAQLDTLGLSLHDLSLGASHLLYQRATERNNAVRTQSQLSIALTLFQCLLLITLAFIVLRQFGSLTERRRSLEALADSLGAARVDAEAASRAKSVFLANMSHEIRTPFHGMLGMMSLLQDSRLTPRQASHLDTARESAHHLLQILNDILDISQLESGKLQVSPQTVDLPQLVTQVEALMHVQALAKGLSLHVDIAPDVPRWVRADATRMKQILFNLLSNAIKFSNTGTITLSVTRNAAHGLPAPAPARTVFTVTDPGIGMPPATVERLFQRFMQGDESTSRRATGTGLGLEISRDLARLMGGDIAVRSEPGAGSTFTMSLPLAAVAAPMAADGDAALHLDGVVRPLRVLVAEDHAVNRAYMEAVLDKLGHHAVFSADGSGAVQAVQAQPAGEEFDIVLMDLHMPGMDGFAAARAIRALPEPRGRVPIVALTADAFHQARDLARESGMDGFLTKPAHLPQLRAALARYASAGAGAAAGSDMPASGPAARPAGPAEGPGVAAAMTIDRAIVDDLIQSLSAGQYATLLTAFFRSRNATLASLQQAVAEASHAALRDHAHGLKGAAVSLGLRSLASLADRPPPPDVAPAALTEWVDEIERRFDVAHAECIRLGYLDR
ncbi:MAG: response regulator [Rhizobacter sp.]|nr:response regulator [Rhizobacter sp.]